MVLVWCKKWASKITMYFCFSIIFLFFFEFSNSQNLFADHENFIPEVKNYVVYQTVSEMVIDGKPGELSWQFAGWSDYFQDIEGDKKPVPAFKTRFKMLWDEQNLYILAELEEPHIWAYYNKHDQIVYHENDFEIFIDPDGDTHHYFEFEINAQNTLFDLFMPKPYRNGGQAQIPWDAAGFKSAVFVDGTLNNPTDKDNKWIIEMAIPFSSLSVNENNVTPQNGEYWKINFSRVQWQTEIKDGKYQKIKDAKTKKYLNENNWVWSQQGVVNMHFPERWGLVMFSSNPVNEKKIAFQMPEEEILAKYLWQVYYRQQDFKKKNGKFAELLSELNLENKQITKNGESLMIQLESEKNGFSALLENENGIKLSVNQEGLLIIIK